MMTRQRSLRRILLASTVMVAALCLVGQAHAQAQAGSVHVMKPREASAAATTGGGNLVDHGGLILPTSTIYAVWWGDPADFPADAQEGVDQFLSGLNGSAYLGTANQYMRGATATSRFGGNLYNYSSPPTVISTTGRGSANPLDVGLCPFFKSAGLQPNPTDIYLLFTSNFPANDGVYCAFHGYQACSNTNAVFQAAYVPNSTDVRSCDGTSVDPVPNHRPSAIPWS